jgi:methanogenic corrinoid protein MtbC1|nr:cobalamin-dependent protein [Candidatus Krumholzibacteria bacterium]
MSMADLLETAGTLPLVSPDHWTLFRQNRTSLVQEMDTALSARPDIMTLLGNNALAIMEQNHRHHADFMVSVFKLGDFQLLARNLPWIYRSYHAHGFNFDYFQVELDQWRRCIRDMLPPAVSAAIIPIYDWMLDQHERVVALALAAPQVSTTLVPEAEVLKSAFVAAALRGDSRSCVKIASDSVPSVMDMEAFYLQVLQPALHKVGQLWENAEISVAQEHLAAAIVNRVMAIFNNEMPLTETWRGSILVSAAPSEFHEIGARMLADVLELDGWEILFTGANVPLDQLMLLIEEASPDILAISVTIPAHLAGAQDIIEAARNSQLCAGMKILVGGGAFRESDDLWEKMGADGYALDAREAKELVRTWQD